MEKLVESFVDRFASAAPVQACVPDRCGLVKWETVDGKGDA